MATLRVGLEAASNVAIAIDGVRYEFKDGYLDVDDATAEGIRRQGRTLFPHLGIAIVDARESAGPATVAELKARLTELGVEVPKGARRADLVELVEQAEAAATEAGDAGESEDRP